MAGVPVLAVDRLVKHYEGRDLFGRVVTRIVAVDDVSFEVAAGETLGLVGESGCGKSTTARVIMRLADPTSGAVRLTGRPVAGARGGALKALRRDMQMVFQDPYSSLNPRMTAGDIVAEPLRNYAVAQGHELAALVGELFARVGLRRDQMERFPHEFSGGQRQRLGIARALGLRPKLIVCDEPVSALDVSVQAQVINLLQDLQAEFGLAYLFVAHDIAVVEHISHRIAVMYAGRIVEIAPKRTLMTAPAHPYTQALLSAVPRPHPRSPRRRIALGGEVPNPAALPAGCRFHPRCPVAVERCRHEAPAVVAVAPGHHVACHLAAAERRAA